VFVTHSHGLTIWSLFTLLDGKLNLNEFVRSSIVFRRKKNLYEVRLNHGLKNLDMGSLFFLFIRCEFYMSNYGCLLF